MKTIGFIFLAVLLMSASGLYAQKTKWEADKAHSKIKFVAVHMGITEVDGQFNDYNVEVLSNKEDFSDAKINVMIEAKSIDTDNSKRDDHLRSDEFFGVESYPEIKFSGELQKKSGDDNYKLKGDLTIKDVTRPVELDVNYKGTVEAMGATRAGFKITGNIDRFDYNIDWNKTFTKGLVVGKNIDIVCDVELTKKEDKDL